jgi:hypothetical protein
MRFSNKIILTWLTLIWIVFSCWIFAVTQFPINFGFVGVEAITGIVLLWTMSQFKDF